MNDDDDRSRRQSPTEPYAGVFRPPRAADLEAERTEERTREADEEAARADSDEDPRADPTTDRASADPAAREPGPR